MSLQFEWDGRKALANLRHHKVAFQEAATAFADLLSLTIPDRAHSEDEERFILLGLSYRNRLLVVIHTERKDVIRIISARKATRKERIQYEQE